MADNIEVKAKLEAGQATRIRVLAQTRANSPVQRLQQTDTFFHAPSGRLKLREFATGEAELIAYHRPDRAGPKHSRYVVVPVTDVLAMRAALEMTMGVRGVVRKTRDLFVIGQTRVHLDRVEGLGDFLELEVVLTAGQTVADGAQVAQRFLAEFEVSASSLVEPAYIDLLHAK
ncbi:MAG: class IV adenylate cyclase [Gammaproteobacteria bacterium]|nr:class IV adenylate cyclase [Gammaproteobacteria bacterium]